MFIPMSFFKRRDFLSSSAPIKCICVVHVVHVLINHPSLRQPSCVGKSAFEVIANNIVLESGFFGSHRAMGFLLCGPKSCASLQQGYTSHVLLIYQCLQV